MKKYISAILIPCMLMQLYGCYSFRDISMDELKRYDGQNDIKIKTNQEEIIINRKTSGVRSMNWEFCDSSIKVSSKELNTNNGISNLVVNNFEIINDSVLNTQIEEKDNFATLALTLGVSAITLYLIAAVAFAIKGGF